MKPVFTHPGFSTWPYIILEDEHGIFHEQMGDQPPSILEPTDINSKWAQLLIEALHLSDTPSQIVDRIIAQLGA